MKTASSRGFTLVELMIVVAIVGILAAVAYPSYQDSVRKSRRADGKTALLQAVQLAERWFTQRNTYDMTAGTPPNGPSAEGHYNLAYVGDATTFLITATPGGAQATDPCGNLTINELGVKGGGMADCW
ncbi:MAG: type IV pilin protein [Pseudomonadota bacterium]|nr:type IV pilin protein [Pseudomonadota bacterium]